MTEQWLPTPQAAAVLGIAACTLKRKRDVAGGFLVEGDHWRFRTDSPAGGILWDVDVIGDLFHKRAVKARVQLVNRTDG